MDRAPGEAEALPGQDALRAAVALLSREHFGWPVPRGDLLGDVPPGEVLRATELIMSAAIERAWPGDRGAAYLARLGETVARLAVSDGFSKGGL